MRQKRAVTPAYNLGVSQPHLAREWDNRRNGPLRPEDVSPGSARRAWWRCREDKRHVWQATVKNRKQGKGCPYCGHRRVSKGHSLADVFPKQAAFWHPTQNGSLKPNDVLPHSGRSFWWRCPRGPDHEWKAPVYRRTRAHAVACPFCAGYRLSVTNSLATLFPAAARSWHPHKNSKLTPRDVSAFSARRFWWRCREGHEWQAMVANRTRMRTPCPICWLRGPRPRRTR